jgi:hypothetical protein
MNTVGKILVILNFLFAVIVGAFLVFDIALRTQWKEKYFELVKEAKAMKEGRDATQGVTLNITKEYKDIQLAFEDSKRTIKDREDAAKVMKETYDVEIAEYKNKLTDKDLTVLAAKQLTQRQADEIVVLKTTIEDRQSTIVQLEASVKVFRIQAQNFESLARTRQIQNEGLLEQLRESNIALTRLQLGVNPDLGRIRNPNEPNPPAVKIDGKIEKVEGTLVQLTIGTDHGLKENNTLDVYRLQPNPQYLGMVRIVDARHHTSVGRLIPSGNAANKMQLREGDLVTSKFK